jgi:hypothetical protein
VAEAKGLFRRYAGDRELESTPFGWVLQRPADGAARIYVNGLRVAEEQRYLFSYDITSPTKALRTALNRERTNVGRTAYTDRVKSILLAASSPDVANALADDLSRFASGTWHDETQLVDVGVHACQVLNALDRVVFLTPDELSAAREVVDRAEGDGFRVIVVPTSIRAKLKGLTDINGDPIVDLGRSVSSGTKASRSRSSGRTSSAMTNARCTNGPTTSSRCAAAGRHESARSPSRRPCVSVHRARPRRSACGSPRRRAS